MEARGFSEDFLRPRYEDLMEPFLLPGMREAVERIKRAVEKGEKVLVYGDYDADGVTASVVMAEALEWAGAKEVEVMLPDRFLDGYGMSERLVERAVDEGVGLVVTVDCGSANGGIIEKLTEKGVDTVVTDHHECPEELPKAVAVVNPKRKDFRGFKGLAGVGVAFLVAKALVREGMIPAGREKWLLDLVLVGTICDSMPMVGENRILGVYGLKVLEKTRRVGLVELMRRAGVREKSAEAVGFQIGPRINAGGRLGSAKLALDLLRAKSRVLAVGLADELEELNKRRQTEQRAVMAEIEARGVGSERVLVEMGNYHEGILGIVAGRLVEDYKRPAFVLTEVTEGILKGSGRSFGEFSLAEALERCREVIISGGGHKGAAGVKVETARIGEFREKINEYYDSLGLEGQERFLRAEADVSVKELAGFSLDFWEEMKRLEPFGEGNREPVFELRGVEVLETRLMGAEGRHLGLRVVGADGAKMKLVAFSAPEEWRRIEVGEKVDVMIRLVENEWGGVRSVEGRVVGVARSFEW